MVLLVTKIRCSFSAKSSSDYQLDFQYPLFWYSKKFRQHGCCLL